MVPIDTYKVLDQLEMLVEESKHFMGFIRLDEDEFFMLISKLRASLPEDVRRAGKIAENSDKIMEAAQTEAEKSLEEAHSEAQQLLLQAREDAESLLTSARTEAEGTISDARERSAALTGDSEISRMASAQAKEILTHAETKAAEIRKRAEADAAEIRTGADDYAFSVLSNLEKHLEDSMASFNGQFRGVLLQVQRGKMSLERGEGPQTRGADGVGGVSIVADRK